MRERTAFFSTTSSANSELQPQPTNKVINHQSFIQQPTIGTPHLLHTHPYELHPVVPPTLLNNTDIRVYLTD
jgi:hypothetical protein